MHESKLKFPEWEHKPFYFKSSFEIWLPVYTLLANTNVLAIKRRKSLITKKFVVFTCFILK